MSRVFNDLDQFSAKYDNGSFLCGTVEVTMVTRAGEEVTIRYAIRPSFRVAEGFQEDGAGGLCRYVEVSALIDPQSHLN